MGKTLDLRLRVCAIVREVLGTSRKDSRQIPGLRAETPTHVPGRVEHAIGTKFTFVVH